MIIFMLLCRDTNYNKNNHIWINFYDLNIYNIQIYIMIIVLIFSKNEYKIHNLINLSIFAFK